MRRDGIWHPRLSELISSLGHTETLVIADAGLPVPRGVESIDLVWAAGEPGFLPVLRAVAQELVVESALFAKELSDSRILGGLAECLVDLPVSSVPHDDLKEATRAARAVVRTGEVTPYANVVLQAGVTF